MWGRKKREDPKPELGTITETVVPAGTPALVIQPLDAEWSQDLAEKRSWIAASVSGSGAPLDLGDPGIALAVIDALLRDGIGAEERWKLEALGAWRRDGHRSGCRLVPCDRSVGHHARPAPGRR